MLMPYFKKILYKISFAIGQRLIAEKMIGIVECENVEITMFGGNAAEQIYKKHSAPHRIFPFVGSKTLGVALATVPGETDEIFKGKRFHEARRKTNRARREGFKCEKALSMKYLDDIYSIHASTSIRQDRPVADNMLDVNEIRKFCEKNTLIHGVFDRNGKLKAYAAGVVCGEIFVLKRCIGHYESLKCGIMFLLVFELLVEMVRHRKLHGIPLWIQHDMFFARTAGARQFKKEAGFRPYRVKWLWSDQNLCR